MYRWPKRSSLWANVRPAKKKGWVDVDYLTIHFSLEAQTVTSTGGAILDPDAALLNAIIWQMSFHRQCQALSQSKKLSPHA